MEMWLGVFRVTKLGQNSAKTDFSKCDQNKKRKSLGKTLPKQLFCHWANRVPTWTKHFSKTHPKLGLLFLNSIDTYCTVTVTITSIHLLCPSLFCDPHSIATTTGSEHGQIKARERLSWMITLSLSSPSMPVIHQQSLMLSLLSHLTHSVKREQGVDRLPCKCLTQTLQRLHSRSPRGGSIKGVPNHFEAPWFSWLIPLHCSLDQ